MHWPGGQKVRGQGHTVTRLRKPFWSLGCYSEVCCCGRCAAAAGYMSYDCLGSYLFKGVDFDFEFPIW